MITRSQIYKCGKGGGMVEVVHDGDGDLHSCGAEMELQEENTVDAAVEKHVPVVEKVAGGYKVKVGSAPHPMEQEHYITFIELSAGNKVYRRYLEPGEEPEAFFPIEDAGVSAREYCNLHGLWKS